MATGDLPAMIRRLALIALLLVIGYIGWIVMLILPSLWGGDFPSNNHQSNGFSRNHNP